VIALGLDEIAAALGGALVLPGGIPAGTVVSGSVQTDSRLVEPGSVFFALPGEETDGALFADAAVQAGAALVIAERDLQLGVPVLVVPWPPWRRSPGWWWGGSATTEPSASRR
jgi:UDP-N-acetylmuramoyl-tripeptide--D-alanyl-D-alanine ligase